MQSYQEKNSKYVLGVGKKAASNLDLQHEIFKADTFSQLEKAGLSKDMVVCDVACGSGIMTEYLAEQVGPNGTVYALDISKDQLEISKARIEKSGHTNVEFILEDINNIDTGKYQKADIVHTSFLLMHVTEPQKVIEIMASLLKPGGVLSMHESSFGEAGKGCGPDLGQLYRLFVEYEKLKGFDYDVGHKIPGLCHELGIFKNVVHLVKHYKTTKAAKTLLSLRIDESRNTLAKAGLITTEEYDSLQSRINEGIKQDISDQWDIMKTQSYILAYKDSIGKTPENDEL